MKNVMKRAWEIYRTLSGQHVAKLVMALRMAWKEVKGMAKETFKKTAKIMRSAWGSTSDECNFTTFKLWENYGKKRIYVADYKGRNLAYIDCKNNNEIVEIEDNSKVIAMVCEIVDEFISKYEF